MQGNVLEHLKPLDWTVDQKTDHLSNTDWGKTFNWQQAQLLAKYLLPFEANAQQTIFFQEDPPAYLGFVCRGYLGIFKSNDSQEFLVAELKMGKVFGEMALIDDTNRSATVKALTQSQLLILHRENFEKMKEEHVRLALDIALHLARSISLRLRLTTGQLVSRLN